MVIKNVSLDIVCGVTSKLPDTNRPEVAFAGKSNVGKSSLINYYKKYSKFLVFPAVFLFICVVAIPFAIGLLYSFTSWRGTYFANGTLMESFVGLDNYMKVLNP